MPDKAGCSRIRFREHRQVAQRRCFDLEYKEAAPVQTNENNKLQRSRAVNHQPNNRMTQQTKVPVLKQVHPTGKRRLIHFFRISHLFWSRLRPMPVIIFTRKPETDRDAGLNFTIKAHVGTKAFLPKLCVGAQYDTEYFIGIAKSMAFISLFLSYPSFSVGPQPGTVK
jgi:hypothetical protein